MNTAKIKKTEQCEYINEITGKVCHGKCLRVVAELACGTVVMHFPRKTDEVLNFLNECYGLWVGENMFWEAA